MKKIILMLFSAMLIWSCSEQGPGQSRSLTYENPDIGLTLTYPDSWKILKKETLNSAIAHAGDKMDISSETVELTKEFAPLIVLSLAKPQKIDGIHRNPNINILVIPIPKNEWKDIDLNTLVQEQISEITTAFPNATVSRNLFPLSNYPKIHNYSSQIQLADRIVTQYQYIYWRPPYFVQIVFASSHPDNAAELKTIINAMEIKPTDF